MDVLTTLVGAVTVALGIIGFFGLLFSLHVFIDWLQSG